MEGGAPIPTTTNHNQTETFRFGPGILHGHISLACVPEALKPSRPRELFTEVWNIPAVKMPNEA